MITAINSVWCVFDPLFIGTYERLCVQQVISRVCNDVHRDWHELLTATVMILLQVHLQ
jgi:hypothetical protein